MPDRSNLLHQWGRVDDSNPRVTDAHDEFLETATGETIIDGMAGLAVVNLGYSVPGVGDAAAEQLEAVQFVNPAAFSTEATDELARKLTTFAPDPLNTAFFVSSGSQAIESTLKAVLRYHRARDETTKTSFVSRWQSYHGSTAGALSLTGRTHHRSEFAPLLHDWPHIPPANPSRWSYDGSPETQARAAARDLERAITQAGPETVAGFVVEFVSGSSLPAAHPHPAYYEEVRRICDEYDVLLVADEVLTGFGRTGERFGIDHYPVSPDIMVVGKGLSNGCAPISGMLLSDEVASTFAADDGTKFKHGFTFGGNPVSSAVASVILDRYTDDLLETVRDKEALLASELAALDRHPLVGDVRHLGLLFGVEFADPDTMEPFDPDLEIARRVGDETLDRGVYVYPGMGSVDGNRGDHVTLAPPLTSAESSIRTIASTLVEALDVVAEDVGVT